MPQVPSLASFSPRVHGLSLRHLNSIIRTSSFPQLRERLRGREARALPGPGQRP